MEHTVNCFHRNPVLDEASVDVDHQLQRDAVWTWPQSPHLRHLEGNSTLKSESLSLASPAMNTAIKACWSGKSMSSASFGSAQGCGLSSGLASGMGRCGPLNPMKKGRQCCLPVTYIHVVFTWNSCGICLVYTHHVTIQKVLYMIYTNDIPIIWQFKKVYARYILFIFPR